MPKNILTQDEDRNLAENEQTIVTPYDIHESMMDIFGFKEPCEYSSRFGISILKHIKRKERNCKTYKFDLLDLWCRCKDY